MKPEQFLLFVVLFFVFWPSSTVVEDNLDILAAEGMVAIQIADTQLSVRPVSKCLCGGTGKVKSPDGITDITCQCGPNCPCQKSPQPDPPKKVCPRCGREDCPGAKSASLHYDPSPVNTEFPTLQVNPPQTSSTEESKKKDGVDSLDVEVIVDLPKSLNQYVEESYINKRLDQQIVWFTARWCAPCHSFDKNTAEAMRKSGWNISEDEKAHIRKVDIDDHKEVYEIYGKNRPLPCFVKLVKGQEQDVIVGNVDVKTMVDFWYKK